MSREGKRIEDRGSNSLREAEEVRKGGGAVERAEITKGDRKHGSGSRFVT